MSSSDVAAPAEIFGAFFNHHKDTDPFPFTLPWWSFAALLDEPHARQDKFATHATDAAAPGYSLARFVPRDGRAAVRQNAYVDVLSGLVFDFDDGFSIDAVLEALDGVAWAAHTTWSHAPGAERWRVIVPLDVPVPGTRYKAARAWLANRFGSMNKVDKAAAALSNFYYLPCCPPGAEEYYESRFAPEGAPFLALPALDTEFQRGLPPPRIAGAKLDWVWLKGRMQAHKDGDLQRAFRRVLKGESFADLGARDNLLTRMCGALAGWATGCEPEQLAEVFAPSLAVMAEAEPLDPPPDVANAADKIARAQASLASRAKEENKALAEDAQQISTPPPEDEEAFAEQARAVRLPDADALRRRLLLRVNNSIWVWDSARGNWRGPMTEAAALTYAQRDLSRVPGVTVWARKADGGLRMRTLSELFYEHGEVMLGFSADLNVQAPYYDLPEEHLVVVGAPRRALEPAFDAFVDAWLRALGGDKQEKLLDWVAGLTRLDYANAVLFIEGDPSVGKGLLARGLARAWQVDSPTEMKNLVKNHGDYELQRCPLVRIDEGKWDRFADVTTMLRDLVAANSRTVNRKYHDPIELRGYLRFLVTANNFNIFASDTHALNPADRAAIARRFFVVKPAPEAGELLASITLAQRNTLAAEDIIARHALWLAAERGAQLVDNAVGRFLVEGEEDSSFATRIVTEDHRYGTWCVEWLARYLTSPLQVEKEQPGLLWRGAGKVLVSPEAVINTFEKVLKNKQRPQSLEISNALRSLSTGSLLPFPEGKGMGFEILVDVVAAWSEEKGVGTPNKIIAAANAPRLAQKTASTDAHNAAPVPQGANHGAR